MMFCRARGHPLSFTVTAFTTEVNVVTVTETSMTKYVSRLSNGTPLQESIWVVNIPQVINPMEIHCSWFMGYEYVAHSAKAVKSGVHDLANCIDPGSAIVDNTNVKSLFNA